MTSGPEFDLRVKILHDMIISESRAEQDKKDVSAIGQLLHAIRSAMGSWRLQP
jgi:hypothetical protein